MMHDREFGAHCGFRTDHAVNLYTSPGMAKVVVVAAGTLGAQKQCIIPRIRSYFRTKDFAEKRQRFTQPVYLQNLLRK